MDRALSERLVFLWNHRGEFRSETEWRELHELVHSILMSYNPSILGSLSDTKQFFIQGFFLAKAFETAGRNNTQLDGPGALCRWFSNYLIDQYRTQDPAYAVAAPESEDLEARWIEQLGFHSAENKLDPSRDALEYRIALEQARSSARDFLATLMDWLCIVLASKFCSDQDEALTAVRLAKELGAASPAYHLDKLGVSKRHGGQGNPDFRDTLLGQWVVSFGVEPIPQNADCVEWLLAQLCHEAQTMHHKGGQQ